MGGQLEIDNFLPLQCLADRLCLLLTSVCGCSWALLQSPRGRDGHSREVPPRGRRCGPGPAEPSGARPACLKGHMASSGSQARP